MKLGKLQVGSGAAAAKHPADGPRQFDQLAEALAPPGPPVVVYCASHSGSRLLAAMLQRLGVFMGAHLNESEDSLDLFELVRHLVESHAPDFAPLLRDGELGLAEQVASTFAHHLDGRPEGQRWGWKLPETANVMPVVTRLFPEAWVIHLVRDGRDVAFSPFVAPKARFWRKIYFGDDRIRTWRGLAMTQRAYRSHGHLFNAARWVNSVTLGRTDGAPLGERYLEMSYEALVAEPGAELARVAAFLGLAASSADLPPVSAASIGKWRRQPAAQLAEIRPILEPTLGAFGYVWDDG
jgi:hypothetical protein